MFVPAPGEAWPYGEWSTGSRCCADGTFEKHGLQALSAKPCSPAASLLLVSHSKRYIFLFLCITIYLLYIFPHHIKIFLKHHMRVDYSTGRGSDVGLKSFRDTIQSLTKTISGLVHGLPRQTDVCPAGTLQLPCLKSVMDARDDLHSALCSLAELFDESSEDNVESTRTFTKAEIKEPAQGPRSRTVPKIVYSLSSGVSSCSRDIRWVWAVGSQSDLRGMFFTLVLAPV